MFTGPVGPVEVFFYWPLAILGIFYWPGAIGPLLASSPALCYHLRIGVIFVLAEEFIMYDFEFITVLQVLLIAFQ